MGENCYNIMLEVIDWNCESCGTYCKPTGIIKQEFIGVQVEHMCMNPACGRIMMLDTNYPKWSNLIETIVKTRKGEI